MAMRKFNLTDKNDLSEVYKLLFDDSEEENTDNKQQFKTHQNGQEDEDYDTDVSENIEAREENPCSEQNDTDLNTDECGD